MARSAKKTETLEIRVSHGAKAAFMESCRREGRTASEVLRDLIELQLGAAPAGVRRPRWPQIIAAAAAGLALGAAAAPSLAQDKASGADFVRLDADHDGLLTAREFLAR